MTNNRNPYEIVKHQLVTEKTSMLQGLKNATNNASLKACQSPKYVFIVDKNANKHQIAHALEFIYKKEEIKVVAVNTINMKPKAKTMRGRKGFKSAFKKAIVTLRVGDSLDNV